tara:strand:- start:138 stop:881 length:744 start_codon:yes stop_codon:yes gene_type:complete
MNVYDNAKYYEIAFGFVDASKQADFFEKLIKKYSKCKVNRVLDIACGPSLQLRELASRGYSCVGLDMSKDMLKYLKEKDKRIQVVKGDMTNFKLGKKADFAFIMMGSITFIRSHDMLFDHLNSVANCLRKGGLYFIENSRLDWGPNLLKKSSWVENKEGVRVKCTYEPVLDNMLKQTLIETLTLEVNDNGKKKVLKHKDVSKQIFPEEFKLLIEKNGKFEFLGFFEPFKFKKLKDGNGFNYILLRRK